MDIQLTPTIYVQYKATSSSRGLTALMLMSPVWAIWAPAVTVWLAWVIIQGEFYTDIAMWILLSIFVALIAISVFSVTVCRQNNFEITSDGIRFPRWCLFELNFRLNRNWTEIVEIQFIDSSTSGKSGAIPSERPDKMNVLFADNGRLSLDLSSFRKEDLQKFVLALQSYVPELPIYPPLPEVRLGLSASNAAQASLSFTQIWEADMASRFGSTVFIPLEPGMTLQNGWLEIMGQIAFGGLSAIYLAKNKDNKLCVVKEAVVPASADKEAKEKALEMFEREAQILTTLNHPRIAKVLDHFLEQGHHYMVLEYLDGKDLRKFVKERGPQNENVVLRWTIQIAEILDYLHKLNPPIVHRDLTPDNLVLEASGNVALIDFGAANEFIGTATGTLVGKQSYISPDQFRGKATPVSDLYSLGATMFFLLTGKDPEALSVSHVKLENQSVSQELDELVSQLTALDPEHRITSAEEVARRCREIFSTMKTKKAEVETC